MSSSDTPTRSAFVFPTNADVGARDATAGPSAYLCGNSLGLLPKRSEELVKEELQVWGSRAVQGHFKHPKHREWVSITDHVNSKMADIVGAEPSEVAVMGTLTANLHLMLSTFYKPTAERYKILCEAHAFPSDQYAFASQVKAHGYDPADAVIELAPREGEHTLREADILGAIREHGDAIAVVLFSGVQYYTGQCFPFESITRAGHDKGCLVGFDLAHAAGNVLLALHAWSVDFAVWCTYKYLNAGPGGIAGLFVHARWHGARGTDFAGWWGHDPATRFAMPHTFSPIRGAQGFQQSNPSVLAVVSLLGSLEVFEQAGGMKPLSARSETLTGLLERGLHASPFYVPASQAAAHSTTPAFTIITPPEPSARGAQLSLLFLPSGACVMQRVFDGLAARGVIGDERRPDVIRLAPAPLYNDESDVERAVAAVNEVLQEIAGTGNS